MSIFGSKSKPPPVQPAPPPPSRSNEDIQAAAAQQREAYQSRGGRASTILTGGRARAPLGFATSLLGDIGQ